jgi:hypothetical protein
MSRQVLHGDLPVRDFFDSGHLVRPGAHPAMYPSLVDYVHRHYDVVGTVAGDEDYVIFARRDRPSVRQYGEHNWPCYAHHS